ncbi:MAG TPA: hypothetical protein VFM98_13420 [Ramlibacter sp.]|uniref:hypothetical protein n=1 Tax=Ramlibacter sp. TaxID=1917967 RepID=UPI002D7F533D|nr:hypothetical protein [Ramlibacter sp.]HET8746601.1 hypothetical protein [Ramlibacter sp.]
MRVLFATGVVLLTSGCAYLSPPAENPIIEQHARNRINTFAVVPARRVVLVKAERANDDNSPLVVCGEAPADVTDNIASTFAASLAASAAKGNEVSAGISRSLETFGQILFKRSQGLQLFRDQSYYLCQARMNNFITDAEYKQELKAAFTAILPLIEQEIKGNAAALQPPASAASQSRVTFIPLTASTPITSVEIDERGKVVSTVAPK